MTRNEKMAYIAGIMDGDGSFSLIKVNVKRKIASVSYRLYIQFSKSSPLLPNLLKDEFGGSILCVNRKDKKRPEYKWRLTGCNNVKLFLESIVDYLHNKRSQAIELIKYINDISFKPGSKLSLDEMLKRESTYLRMKLLNAERDSFSKISFCAKRKKVASNVFWSYLAGLLDTDGSFSIKREIRGISARYSVVLLLSLIHSKAMNFIKRHCDQGRLNVIRCTNARQKFIYRWGIYSKDDAKYVLEKVMPCLVHKKKAAEILLEFLEGYAPQTKYTKTKEQCEFRESCYKKLIEFNYGVYKPFLMDLKLLPGSAGDNKAEAGVMPGTVNVVSEKAPL